MALAILKQPLADAGKAQTLMILGSDMRYADREAGLKPKTPGVTLGLPSFGKPAPLPAAVGGCAVG